MSTYKNDGLHGGDGDEPSPQEINMLVDRFNQKRYAEMETLARDMAARFPHYGLGWKAIGTALLQQGRIEAAVAPLQKAAELSPGDSQPHNNLGNTFLKLGRLQEAEASYRYALQINPGFAEAHNNLGNTLQKLDRLSEAESSYRYTLQINPGFAEAHNNLGNVLLKLGRSPEAEACFRRALEIKPNYADAHHNLGNTLMEQNRVGEAEASFRRTLEIRPDHPDAHYNLGNALMAQYRLPEAEASFRRALEIKPDFYTAYYNLGNTLLKLDRMSEAEASFRRALEIKADFAEAHCNLGNISLKIGQIDDAVASFHRAIAIKPDLVEAHTSLIFAMDMADTAGLPELQRERRKWDEAYAAPLWQEPIHYNDRSPARRLRIGYVSADFRRHSAVIVFCGMLTQYDHSQFDVFAYSNFGGVEDKLTDLFRQSVTVWRNIAGLSDEAVAKMIREDRIDILVDLSGHTADNRLLVFARKPAPIQITAWGYANGTGMRAMDVFFADPVLVPPQDKQHFSEEVRYLPSFLGALFTEPFPDVNELPALSNGSPTFGSLNRLVKMSEKSYRAWAEMLLAVPGSRLMLKTPELDDASTRERIVGHFTKAGVAADRVIMQGATSRHEHLQTCNQIDIALDPFPHNGGVTTMESLMMGVPVIALRGATTAGRTSASILTTLELTGWIAETREQYVELAIQKARDLQDLAALRQQLRGIFTSSILGDQVAYVRAVEQEYHQLWLEWCTNCSPRARVNLIDSDSQ